MPEIYNIPAGYSFLRELARAILSRKLPCLANMDTNNLSQVLILLPTQRACRDLREILFEENNKKALIMPEIKAFGALEDEWVAVNSDHSQVAEIFDIEQAIAPLERHLILAKYISKLSSLGGIDGRLNLENPAMALHMAKDLAKLFDSVLIEEADPSKFEQLVEAEFAENWLLITKFLDVVFKTWPDVLAEVGKVDQIVRRQKLMQLELLHLQNKEVEGQARPIIAAGSTASVAATKKFLSGILGLSQGCVILSGLDTYMDEESWEEVSLAHPQNNLKNFLSHANVKREDVLPLPSLNIADDDALTLRAQIASEMVRPTATSHMWHNLPEKFNKRTLSDAISGNVELVEANNVQQEAIIIALMMRKAVEDKQKAALITPDRQLARRVQNELKRWNIHVDDSSGVPLSDTPPSIFLKHIIDVQLHEFSPSSLLSLLKHPYFRTKFSMDMDRISAQKAIYALELILLRGVRPAKGIDGLLNVLQLKFIQKFEKNDDYQYQHKMVKQLEQQDWQLVKQLLENLAKLFASFDIKKSDNFAVIFAKHLKIAEQLSLIDSNENSIIWQSNEGEALAQLSSEILQSQDNFEKVNISEYEALLANLMSGNMVRSKDTSYGGLAILGALEARLADLDIAILGGLNEGVWPQIPQADAWVSRKMMAEIGLPAPERRVGLSAHDFVAAFNVKKVYLTRAEKLGGAPTTASRWILRLNAVLNAMQMGDILLPKLPWAHWADEIDRPDKINPNSKPEPRPPVAARPRQMSVTDIETWIRDPYAIYVKKVLKISPLDDLELEISAAEKGSLFHEILHKFSQCYGGEIKEDAMSILVGIGADKFSDIKQSWPQLYAFWWPRFLRVADWFLHEEANRRLANPSIATEIRGQMVFEAKYGADALQPFTLTARADRVDILAEKAEIIDYKTGAPPSVKQVKAGFAPQLLLEASILASGGFAGCDIDKKLPIDFSYIQLTGAYPAGKIQDFKKLDGGQLIEDVLKGLSQRIEDFSNQETAYKPRELADFAARFRDYDHLARMKEWSLIEGDE